MLLLFEANGCKEIVEGSLLITSVEEAKKADFEKKKSGAFLDLIRFTNGYFKEMILEEEDVVDAWKALAECCFTPKHVELNDVKKEIDNVDGDNLLEAVTKLKTLLKKFKKLGGTFLD